MAGKQEEEEVAGAEVARLREDLLVARVGFLLSSPSYPQAEKMSLEEEQRSLEGKSGLVCACLLSHLPPGVSAAPTG